MVKTCHEARPARKTWQKVERDLNTFWVTKPSSSGDICTGPYSEKGVMSIRHIIRLGNVR